MTSTENNNYVTVEMFNAGIESINNKIDKAVTTLTAEIKVIDTRINSIDKRIDDVQFYFSIYFGVVTLIITVVGIIPLISNFIKNMRNFPTIEKMQEMIDTSIAKTLGSLKSN